MEHGGYGETIVGGLCVNFDHAMTNVSVNVSVKIKLYTDDSAMSSQEKGSDDQVLLNNAFKKVIAWCNAWQMLINFDKTVFMRITHKKETLKFQYFSNNFLFELQHYKNWMTKGAQPQLAHPCATARVSVVFFIHSWL